MIRRRDRAVHLGVAGGPIGPGQDHPLDEHAEQHEAADHEEHVADGEAEHDEGRAEGADDRPVGEVGRGDGRRRLVGAGQLGQRPSGLASRLIRRGDAEEDGGHADGHQERVAEVVADGAPVARGDRTEPVAAGAPAVGGREHERHGAEPEEPL